MIHLLRIVTLCRGCFFMRNSKLRIACRHHAHFRTPYMIHFHALKPNSIVS